MKLTDKKKIVISFIQYQYNREVECNAHSLLSLKSQQKRNA